MTPEKDQFPSDPKDRCGNHVGSNWMPCIRYKGHRFDGSKLRCRSNMPKDAISSSNPAGTCQACFRGDLKVQNGYMSLHGYQRPGWGYTVGRCLGAQRLPYEHSCEVTKEMLRFLQKHITDEEAKLEALQAQPEALGYTARVYVGYEHTTRAEGGYKNFRVTVQRGQGEGYVETDFTNNCPRSLGYSATAAFEREHGRPPKEGVELAHHPAYDRVLASAIMNTEAEIKAAKRQAEFLAQKIAEWKPRTLKAVA